MELYYYPNCGTCKKAIKWLDQNGIVYTKKNIVEHKWTYNILDDIFIKSQLPIEKLFNTSGLVYRELNLKDKLKNMTLEEKLTLLASNGMLLKRPILVDNEIVIIGFDENKYINKIK